MTIHQKLTGSPPVPARERPIAPAQTRIWVISAAVVICWASGFVVPHAFAGAIESNTFVAARNVSVCLALAAIAVAARDTWPSDRRTVAGLMWAGALFQGVYLMAIYWAVAHGLPSGLAALIGALQPALTAIFAYYLENERMTRGQIGGLALGLAGVALVMAPRLEAGHALQALALSLLCLVGVVAGAYGSVYQKRFTAAGGDWARTALIFAGAALPPVTVMLVAGPGPIHWTGILIGAYLWAVFALGVGATTGFLYLIKSGHAAIGASLLYLVPPVSALMAYAGFGEPVTLIQMVGFAVAAAGVFFVHAKNE